MEMFKNFYLKGRKTNFPLNLLEFCLSIYYLVIKLNYFIFIYCKIITQNSKSRKNAIFSYFSAFFRIFYF